MQPKQLNIVVIGAGLGGLSAAVALRRKGHNVVVFEATKHLLKAGAGIQIPPVSTRILQTWGLDHALKSKICEPEAWLFRRYDDDSILGAMPLNPYSEQHFGAPWWVAHRADYQKLLYDAALDAGAVVHLDCRVIAINDQDPSVTVDRDGDLEIYNADLVVGADGVRSGTRAIILGDDDVVIGASEICAYRALVPAELMLKDEKRAQLMKGGHETVWVGPGHHVLAYPIRQGSDALYNLVLVHPENDSHTTHDLPAKFPRPAFVNEVEAHFANFSPDVRNVVQVVQPEGANEFFLSQMSLSPRDGILEWKLGDLPALPRWSSRNGNVVLIGDAAHASKPYMSSGAAMAVEDAVALGEFLDPGILAESDLSTLMTEFERLRKPRTTQIQRYSASDALTWSIDDGAQQRRRDELLSTLGGDDPVCAEAFATMKREGIGSMNFGDPSIMKWLSSYDVQTGAESAVERMLKPAKGRI